jgi:hypothetical protein
MLASLDLLPLGAQPLALRRHYSEARKCARFLDGLSRVITVLVRVRSHIEWERHPAKS